MRAVDLKSQPLTWQLFSDFKGQTGFTRPRFTVIELVLIWSCSTQLYCEELGKQWEITLCYWYYSKRSYYQSSAHKSLCTTIFMLEQPDGLSTVKSGECKAWFQFPNQIRNNGIIYVSVSLTLDNVNLRSAETSLFAYCFSLNYMFLVVILPRMKQWHFKFDFLRSRYHFVGTNVPLETVTFKILIYFLTYRITFAWH